MPINFSTSPAVFRWHPACWLRVSGEDAAHFLQGQFTNDLRALAPTKAVYGLWLTLKGKVLADSFVLRGHGANEFWVGSYFSAPQVIRERLESFIIADDVVVDDVTNDWAAVSLLGDTSMVMDDRRIAEGDGFLFPGRRETKPNFECVYRQAAGEPAWVAAARPSLPALTDEEMARRRITAGIPAIPADVGLADLPNEAGLEDAAISYTKGCYLGQEVMARLKSMGQVRRRLVRVVGGAAATPTCPAPVFAGARQVGELRSAVRDGAGGWIGLAMVSRLHVTAGTRLSFAAEGEPGIDLVEVP